MKHYLIIVLAILLIVSSSRTYAQIKAGYIIGVNISNMSLKTTGICSHPKPQTGIHFGGIMEIPVAGNFTFQPRILLSAKGSNYKIDSVDYSVAPIFIEIPLLAGYSFGSDDFKIFFFAGPYFAFGIGGYKVGTGGQLKDINYGTGENKDLKPLDLGLNIGAGIYIKGFQISAQYGSGFSNLSPMTTDDTEMKNKVIGISVSSLIARK